MVTAKFEFDIPPKLKRDLRSGALHDPAAKNFIKRTSFELMSRTVENAPVGVGGAGGGLRGSVSIDFQDKGLAAVVGSDLNYAGHVEFGTRPHWPPWGPGSALARWAFLKRIPVFVVARAIARRGTRAQKYMERAVDSVRVSVIPGELKRLGKEIQQAWGKLA